ncbi:uncharacterized protein LOC118080162 isoform X1 [Zootoca vivipara]|uniref:uncharacterized protein LOC118080162 isoform X1 n=1 Tax=Zootoca vivipara TaxID=8524 RepID=UPI00293BE6D3|nr:uncharacterized protein LOC118080162 isoform X1 [Zootoca vivipara]
MRTEIVRWQQQEAPLGEVIPQVKNSFRIRMDLQNELPALLTFVQVAVFFTEEEWALLDPGQRAPHKEVMEENYEMVASLAETLVLSSELISSLGTEKYRDAVLDQLRGDGEGNQNYEGPPVKYFSKEMDGGGEDIPSKKAKKLCKYLEKWESEFSFVNKSRVGHSYAFCAICSCDFSVAHGGRTDITQHEKSAKHKRGVEAQKHAPMMPRHAPTMSRFATSNTTEADQVIKAEVKMAMLCAKNNISFTFCDDFNKCVADIFPDSAIARKYSAGKTKTTQIIKGAIAAELDDELAKTCRSQPFSLMCDELNRKAVKEFVIMARLYDEANLQVVTRFFEMPICKVGNAENLYEKLSEALRKRGIPWENLIAFNSDNASVMKDKHDSVISRLRTTQPHIQDLGCICHLVQLATGCAIREAQVPVEDILVRIYTHFDKSAKRCEVDKEFVDFTDSDHLKLLRYYCNTRWLSLLTCIQRVLNQWAALTAYFNSLEEVEKSANLRDLASHLGDPVVKIYFLFLAAALKPLSEFNIAFQSEEVQIHRLEEEMCKLIKKILGFLVPARTMVGVPLREVKYGGHQLADEDLFIGEDTRAFMRSTELPVSAENKIFQTVRRFYEAVLQQMFSSFPLDNPLLRDLKVLDPAARLDVTPEAVERLVALLPQLNLNEDRLREELIDYQLTDSKQLPQEEKIDRFWGLLGKDVRFRELPRLMKALLCIPHSNASSERVFSMVRKIVTENRMSLDNSTVCALLSCKINHSGPAHKYTPSKRVLKDAKSATRLYNKWMPESQKSEPDQSTHEELMLLNYGAGGESPMDCKKIKPIHSEGHRPWLLTGRTDPEASHEKRRLPGKETLNWGKMMVCSLGIN